MQKIETQIKAITITALAEFGMNTDPTEIHLEHPADTQFGDYSTNIAMKMFRQIDGNLKNEISNPRDFAYKITDVLNRLIKEKNIETLSSVSVAGPGFINFTLSDQFLLNTLKRISDGEIEQTKKGKKIIVEYSSPNIAKPFTIGHLRSTIIGDSVANLLEATGATVFRDNHLGDWGTQFGKQISAIKRWGNEDQIDHSDEPIKELVALYVRFHEEAEKDPTLDDEARAWFKKLEDGDPEARRLWKKCIDWSMKEFARIYKKLGVTFTENNGLGYGESFFEKDMTAVIDELKAKKLLTDSQGAQLVFFPEDKLSPLMMIKKDGATLYATRDLATDKFRLEHYGKDIQVINEVGIEQSEYFRQLYEVEYMLGWYKPGQRVHIGHGHYRFKDQKMSTRKGNVIWLDDVLKEAITRAEKVIAGTNRTFTPEESAAIALAVGIGALKWNDLKRSSHLDITFDWDEILNMNGNSGPYLQYTYARAQSVLKKHAAPIVAQNSAASSPKNSGTTAQNIYDPNAQEKAVLRSLYQFNEVIQRATDEFAPHYVCTYLFELAQSFNTFYNKHHILGEDADGNVSAAAQQNFRLELTSVTAQILQRGLGLLGIQVVERM